METPDVELKLSMCASLDLVPADGVGSHEMLAPFEITVLVPETIADLAVGAMHWDAKDLLEGYVADAVMVDQNASFITVRDADGSQLVQFERPEKGFIRESTETLHARGEDGKPMSPFFVADDSDAVTLQISKVERAEV